MVANSGIQEAEEVEEGGIRFAASLFLQCTDSVEAVQIIDFT